MKKKGKLKFALIILIIISALVGLYIGMCKQRNISIMNAFQNLRKLPEDLEGWNLSLLMYDSAVENGMSAVNNDVWDATNTNEKRVVTVQVNLSNTALAKDYEPGELVISVDSLGKISPTNEAMTNIKAPTTISADLNTKVNKDYDWSYRYDSASQKFIFTNNNLIEFGSTFESTIQMAFEFSAPYVLNGADVTINADLNGELNSINTLNYKFTSNKRPGTNPLSFSKLNSYDGLGENATDYYWAKFINYGTFGGSNVRYYLFDTYIDFTVPEGCLLYTSNMTQILPDENDIYKLYDYSNTGSSYVGNTSSYFYIAFPKEIYENQTIDLTSSWYGKYNDSYSVKGDLNKELETIASNTKTLNLSEFEIVYNGNLYSVTKSTPTYRKLTYNKIINENKGEIITFRIGGTTIYTGNKYKARYGDDILYISNTEGGYTKLTDDEYCFKKVYIPGSYTNGNSQSIEKDKYDIDLYVRYRGTNSYVKYGETIKNGTSKTITFSDGEFVVGWYIEIYDLEESLKLSSSISTDVFVQKSTGLAETGKIYNFDYLQVFNKVEDEYVLVNQPEATSYNTNTITTELAENDLTNYGVYLQRDYASKEYGNDYEYYYVERGIQNLRYDNNYFYRDVYLRPYLDNYSTGTDAFDGYNLFTIIPEGAELNATKEELFDLITKSNSNSFVNKSYKPDGTQFTSDEMYSFLKEHLTITIDTNYQDTGKTWIGFKEDFGDTTFDTYETGGSSAYFPIQYIIPIKIPYESYFTHGTSYTIQNYIAPLKDDETFSYNRSTDTNDIDNDGDRTDYYSLSNSISTTIVPAVSSYQEASKNVWTETSENRYVSEFAVAKNGGNYKYKLKVRTGSNEITNLMIYDNLENASNDWKGTFVGIDTSFTNSQGFNPIVYVSDDRDAGTLEDDATNWRLYDSSVDNSEVKSVAIDYGSAVIPAGFLTFVEVDMNAPEDPNIKTLAKNISYTKWNAIDLNGNIIDNVEGVTGNTVNVGLGKTEHDIVVRKVWNDNDDEHHVRPSSVIIHLLRNNVEINQIELNDGNNWTHTFNNLQIYDDEYKKYEYTITENPVNLYTPSVQYEELVVDSMSRTFTITNTVNESELFKDIIGDKIWNDNNNARGRRPSSVTIDLYRDGSKIDTTTTDANNDWYYEFTHLPKWKNNAEEYNYTINEVEDEHYNVAYDSGLYHAKGAKLKFSAESKTESVSYDYVSIYYKWRNQVYRIGSYGGTAIANKEITIPTNEFYIYWRTDGSNHNYYGFSIDSITPVNYEGDIIGTAMSLPNYTPEEISGDTYPESEHTYQDNVNQMWHYTLNNPLFSTKTANNITNTYKLIPSTVLVHHYIKDTTTSLVPDETINGYVWDTYETFPSNSIPTYYKLVETPSNATGEFGETQKVVDYFYEYKDYNYTIEYYYDGIKDDSKTETKSATYADSISSYTDKVIEGYEFNHVEGTPLVITENVGTNLIKAFYTKRNDLSYTVHYKEQGSNATLSEDKVVNNKTYLEEVTENAIDISGYDKVDPTTQSITMQVSGNEMTFFYTKRTDLSYTVHYKEQGSNTTLAEDKVVNNKTYLEEVTENAIDISGYDKVNPTTQTITMQVSGNEMTFFYTKRTDLSYTVHYKEQGSNATLSEDKVVNNKTYLEEVTESAIDINGYNKVDPTTQTITMQVSGNEMTFFYTKRNDLSYTVHYKEQGSNATLSEDKVVNNKTYLEEVTENAIDISGYDKVNPTTQTITMQVSGNEMTFFYTKRTDLSYTVHYKEQGSNATLSEDKVVNNKTYLEEVTENAIDINGYNKVDPTTQTITMQASGNEMTFFYTKRTDLSYIVHYKEQGSNATLSEDKVENNKTYLEEVTEDAIDIEGYNKVNPTTQTITMQVSGNEITFYYTKRGDLSYTVHYKEQGSNATLSDDKIKDNQVFGNVVNELPIVIDGYDIVNPEAAQIEITTGINEHTFYYTKRTDLNYTVYYREQGSNQKLAEEKFVDNKTYLEEITENAIDIEGYNKVDPTTKTITIQSENNEIIFYYTKRNDLSYVVHYKEQGSEETLARDKVESNKTYLEEITENAIDIDGYNKVNPTSQTITIRLSGNEMTFYYTKRTDLNYTVHYKEQGTNEKIAEDKVINNQEFGSIANETAIDISGYQKLDPTSADILITSGTNEYTFYYKKNNYNYTVEYYYNNIIDESKTDVISALYNDEIRAYELKPKIGYKFDRAEGTPLTITTNEDTNLIKVFYKIDEEQRKDLHYTVVYFKDNILIPEDTVEKTESVQVLEDDLISVDESLYTDEDKYDGYTINCTKPSMVPEKVKNDTIIHVFYIPDQTLRKELKYTVEYYKDGTLVEEDTQLETESVQILQPDIISVNKEKINTQDKYPNYVLDYTNPRNIPDQVETDSTIKIYYVRRSDLQYTVHYKEQGTNKIIAEDKVVKNQTYGDTVEETAIDIKGYDKVNPITAEIEITTGANEYTFYYNRSKFKYTVEHYYENVIDDSKTDTIEATYLDEITTYTEKPKVGYMFDKVEGTPLIITTNENENVIKVYYEKDPSQTKTLKYTVNYYKDGYIQENDTQIETQEVQVLSDDILNVDKAKINITDKYEDYTFEKIEPSEIPDTIENGGIIDVFYTKTKHPYTVEYYYNNIKDIDATESGQAYTNDVINTYTNKDKEGYEFDDVDGLPLIISSTEENIIKVYYLPIRKITINHIDKNTNEVIKTEERTGKEGYSITTGAEDFEGYICVEKPEVEKYTYTEDEQIINYYYAKLSSGVIEKHIDLISGKLIADDVHYDGYDGKEYTTSIKDIANYKHASNKQYYRALIEKDPSMLDGSDTSTVDEYLEKQGIDGTQEYIPENNAGKMTEDVIEVKYYYVPNTKLIVKYVDISTGEEIIKSEEKDTVLDEEYTTSMQEINEYIPIKNKVYYKNYFNNHPNELKDETVEEYMTKNNIDPEATYKPNNSEGTMTVIINQDDTYSNETIVTYYYSKVREVVIKYYDIITGKEISEEIIKAGPDGDLYDISDTKKDIEGYTIVEAPEIQSGIYQEHNETRNYYYAKNTQVVVKYVDKDTGNEIAKSQTIDGYVGKGYTTEKENVDGYYYLTSTDNTSGKMTEDTLEVIYYYNKPKYSSCTINYLDTETGKPIKESKVITDQKVETTIYAKALIIDIANYTFDHFDKDSIIIKEGENTINLYYTKIEEPKKEPTKQEPKIIIVKTPEEKPVVKEPDNSVRISNTGKSIYIDKVLGTILIFTGCVIIIANRIRDIHNKRKE